MNMFRSLALIASLLIPTAAISQTAEEKAAAEQLVTIDHVAVEVATKYNIPKDAAIEYLKLQLKAKDAEEKAKIDGKTVTMLFAKMVEKYSTVYIASHIILAEGTAIYESMKNEPVGTAIPKERVAIIQKWASKAMVVNKMQQDAATAHMAWNMERFTSNPVCRRDASEFNIKTCIDLLKSTTDEFKSVGDTLEGAVKTINVIVLAIVPRMTY